MREFLFIENRSGFYFVWVQFRLKFALHVNEANSIEPISIFILCNVVVFVKICRQFCKYLASFILQIFITNEVVFASFFPLICGLKLDRS